MRIMSVGLGRDSGVAGRVALLVLLPAAPAPARDSRDPLCVRRARQSVSAPEDTDGKSAIDDGGARLVA